MDEAPGQREQSFDFSDLNLQYLIRIRDLTQHDPHAVSSLLGIPTDLAQTLTQITPEALTQISKIKSPLMIPRQDCWWWRRLLTALQDGQDNEIDTIIEHAILLTSSQSGKEA